MLHNVSHLLFLTVKETQRNCLLHLKCLVHLFVYIDVIFVESGLKGVSQRLALGWVRTSIFDFQIASNFVLKLRKHVIKCRFGLR